MVAGRSTRLAAAMVALVLAAAPAVASAQDDEALPFLLTEIVVTQHDGVEDDLLTAGLGRSGLADPTPPGFEDPLEPTSAELRRRAIYENYRALVDTSPGGGYGVLFGPNVGPDGTATDGEGRIPGTEYLALAESGTLGRRYPIAVMVQVPDSFDPERACLVTGTASGSRGIYGAIGTSGEWGLTRGCAVAYTDKGGGTGAHDLARNLVYGLRGETLDAADPAAAPHFAIRAPEALRLQYDRLHPNRFAFKHAHSRRNPERYWGRDLLLSVEFAFAMLARQFGAGVVTPDSTVVIASSISNGGGAALRAAEQDRDGLIDGVAVSEPNVQPRFDPGFTIVQGDGEPLERHSRPLLDYVTMLYLFQPCASLAPDVVEDAPFNEAANAERCAALADIGLLESEGMEEQAEEAQALLNAYGLLPEQNLLQPLHYAFYVPQAVAVTYANAYGRFSVLADLCGYSFGATDPRTGRPVPLSAPTVETLFALSGGIPPTAGISLINELAPDGPLETRLSTPDMNLEGALCLRGLTVGMDAATGLPLRSIGRSAHRRIRDGIAEVRATANLRGTPAVIVHGRSDAVLPPNHTSRAYYGRHQRRQGGDTLRYYEVLNAHHLDALNGLDGLAERYVPLHPYFLQALDLMHAHLTEDAGLPPSQVVRTTPRGSAEDGAPPLTADNVPPIRVDPPVADRIVYDDRRLTIPD